MARVVAEAHAIEQDLAEEVHAERRGVEVEDFHPVLADAHRGRPKIDESVAAPIDSRAIRVRPTVRNRVAEAGGVYVHDPA